MYLWRQLDVDQLETLLSWKPGVHTLHGLVLPRAVEYTLSLNLKFLYPTKRKSEVAMDWFEELVRKVRWRAIAWQEGWTPLEQDPRRNDPMTSWQLGLPFPKSRNVPPIGDDWLNEGIQAGREFLSRSLTSGHSVPQLGGSRDVLRKATLSPNRLREYMEEERLLAFISDKNLGIVITTCDWYKNEIQKFLGQMTTSNQPVFRRATMNFADFHYQTCQGLERLARGQHHDDEDATGVYLPFLQGKKMVEFWSECWIKADIPQFHGIPKIHKNPWNLRPIVPMHSYVTSQLAKILHHMLLPVQRSFTWICESSRTLCSEVAEFNKSLTTSTRLHTGDVTAMYTSIHGPEFAVAISSILIDGNWYDRETRFWIIDACRFLWSHTVFQVGSELYVQLDGIPMGIHCGPVFANLFMAHFEKQWLSTKPADFFYRRFIDDCFAIYPSDELVHTLRCSDLDIVWADSDHGLSFLDVYFHTHLGQAGVCFRPFEKTLNHHQYLPWASSHPISVKKGMIKGELSRIRAISYKQSYFLTWKTRFLSRLRLRGWDARALKAWARQVQWRNYFPSAGLDARKKSSRIIAVSKYNPVWDTISSTDIWQTMRTTWLHHRHGPQAELPFPPNCLIAKKRTRSLWDDMRSVNRNLLRTQLEEINIEELSDVTSSLTVNMPYSPF
ncbi:hypothetical protein M3J09_012137 [Ascochyta lentis]